MPIGQVTLEIVLYLHQGIGRNFTHYYNARVYRFLEQIYAFRLPSYVHLSNYALLDMLLYVLDALLAAEL